jgi:hypothetical protein
MEDSVDEPREGKAAKTVAYEGWSVSFEVITRKEVALYLLR